MTAVVAGAFAFVPVALPLGLAVWMLARRDLKRMRRGVTDPHGLSLTEEARVLGMAATGAAVVFTVGGAILALRLFLFGHL